MELPDFANSAVVELDVPYYLKTHGTTGLSNAMRVNVTISYDEHTKSGVKHWVVKNVPLILQEKDSEMNPIDRKDGQLIRAIDSILYTTDQKTGKLIVNQENANKKILLTGIMRTNGKTIYNPQNQTSNITEVFNLSDEDVQNLLSGVKQGILGIVARGSV